MAYMLDLPTELEHVHNVFHFTAQKVYFRSKPCHHNRACRGR